MQEGKIGDEKNRKLAKKNGEGGWDKKKAVKSMCFLDFIFIGYFPLSLSSYR
jgi:hypothetical protein